MKRTLTMAKTEQGRKCRQFYCDHRRDRWCCADCPEPCSNPCLNSPQRCGLVDEPKPPAYGNKAGIAYRSLDPAAAKRLYDQGLTDTEIGERLGCSTTTVQHWRKAEGLGQQYRRKKK